jgi:hypothetical protein
MRQRPHVFTLYREGVLCAASVYQSASTDPEKVCTPVQYRWRGKAYRSLTADPETQSQLLHVIMRRPTLRLRYDSTREAFPQLDPQVQKVLLSRNRE